VKAKKLYESSEYALVSGAMICLDYLRWIVRGLEDSIIDTVENSPDPGLSSQCDTGVDDGFWRRHPRTDRGVHRVLLGGR
jgi:hypothetical protein